jgi:hypothetical protein
MSESPVQDILMRSSALYSKKNADYGDSWRLGGETMALWLAELQDESPSMPTDPQRLAALFLFARQLDKLIRTFNGMFCKDSMEVPEGIAETAEDMVTYSAMLATLAYELEENE